MTTKEILETMSTLFFGFILHRKFIEEINDLLKHDLRGKEARFFKSLTTQLNHIKTFGRLVHTVDDNEQIKGADGNYFSIHLQQSQFNVRFLIYVDESGEPFFLCAFYERAGKKRTDYSSYTAVAEQRLKELLIQLGGNDNE